MFWILAVLTDEMFRVRERGEWLKKCYENKGEEGM